jgi:hypothetical protein
MELLFSIILTVVGGEIPSPSARLPAEMPSSNPPPIEASSIEKAIDLFGIQLSHNCPRLPVIDIDLPHRGKTYRNHWSETASVVLGRAAFSSWSILASTIEHEVAHCDQPAALISALDYFFPGRGTAAAEALAYSREMALPSAVDHSFRDEVAGFYKFYMHQLRMMK